jgi:hypothetical protein
MDSISKPVTRPSIVAIFGDAGLGKTSLAVSFPNPIVIRAEDGLQSVDEANRPDAFPLLKEPEELWEQLTALIKEEHDYKTVVIDSVTALERMFAKHIVDNDKNDPMSINQALGGYGAGVAALGAMHHRVRRACGVLNEKRGMHVIFIGHADTDTLELPDEEPYTRYTLRLGKKSIAPYVDDSDIVGFLKLKMHVIGEKDKRKKAFSNGERLLVTYPCAANVSKNRYGITTDLPVIKGVNPFINLIPGL